MWAKCPTLGLFPRIGDWVTEIYLGTRMSAVGVGSKRPEAWTRMPLVFRYDVSGELHASLILFVVALQAWCQ
jgi:hypothetical protein